MFTTLSYNKVGKKYVTLDQTVDALIDKFEGFSISKSGMDKHLKENCSSMLKRITKIPAKQNSPTLLNQDLELLKRGLKILISVLCKAVSSLMGLGSIFLLVIKTGTKWKELIALHIHVLDVLDKHNLKDCNLVMDNAPIHKPEKSTEEVNKRGILDQGKGTCSQISDDRPPQLSSKTKRGCGEGDS
ncbi:hypothetical protein G6F46_002124 [Rhizopus delemar]|uniref:Tc1-like transposase DDE domain-containing protein n=2 Tax=Rhizopus TaxID=4842 RepID=A0A9P6Z7S5_9FUNG|nr:hypothetical protein G6F55_003402 [Rhizopus delemar]KAG1547800.1 hypothetical protein G6F51_004047 [Rhizopus arrhizus]KAG1499942.1 hypothetical protein G6F54_004058 [Rhizopus delemar]KAG1514420.1 hypothetical protein G6F53_003683 [Rhizopus delemar]KAG1525376.1 hypothetical protein G6F52_003385 [Rhizopus delemar]